MRKGKELYAAIAAFFALAAAAVQPFLDLSVLTKLLCLGIGEAILLYIIVDKLLIWIKSRPVTYPFNKKKNPVYRIFGALFSLILICASFSALACAIVDFNAVKISELKSANDSLRFSIRGSINLANNVRVQFPNKSSTKCMPKDPSHQPDYQIINWDSSTPQLKLINFSYPQRLFFECTPRIDLRSVIVNVDPPAILTLRPNYRCEYFSQIFIAGGLLCLLFVVFFFIRLQSYL